MAHVLLPIAASLLVWLAGGIVTYLVVRHFIKRIEKSMGVSPSYHLWEILWTLKAHPLSSILLTMQRAHSGLPAQHPMGSAVHRDWLDEIGFDAATFSPPPQGGRNRVNLTTVIGPGAQQPLRLSMPVIVAPMGYGIGLAAETKVALAQGATLAGSAVVSGEGPYLPEERAYAERWILQQSRGNWAHQPGLLGIADMIELQWGQGSEGGMAIRKPTNQLPHRVQKAVGGSARIKAAPFDDIKEWVEQVKGVVPDCPIGLKIPATQHLERDLSHISTLPLDAITLDASGAGSAGSIAVISDHQGISAALATYRAHRWLTERGLRQKFTLIISGGLHGAADIARILALGADVVAVGSAPLLAALHDQIARHFPWVSPTELVFARSSKNRAPRLDVDLAAEHVANWFWATRTELEVIIHTLGYSSLKDFQAARPLIAHSEAAQKAFHLPYDGDTDQALGMALNDGIVELTLSYRQVASELHHLESTWRELLASM